MKRFFFVAMTIGSVGRDASASAPPQAQLPEIVVSGERLTRPMTETASSVVVTSGDALDARPGLDRVDESLAFVPNLQLGSGAEGPSIRGQDSTGVLTALPAFLGGARPRSTLQVDGRALGFNEFVFGSASLWDVERIEVFRSPQTTTQGRNAIGGAIFVETRDPEYSWRASGRVQWAEHGTRQASGALTGPLIDEQLALRIAADSRRSRTSSSIAERMPGASPNRDDSDLLRIKLLVEPQSSPGSRLETSYVHAVSVMPQLEGVVAPFEARSDPTPGYGVFSITADSLTATLDHAAAPALDSTTTLSYGEVGVIRFAPTGLGQSTTRSRDFSAESVFRWHPDGPLRLLAGLQHSRSRLDQSIDLSAVLGPGEFVDAQSSLGFFGEAVLQPSSRLGLTAGLRYQRDRQDRRGGFGAANFALPVDFDRTFDAWLPKIALRYAVTPGLNVGVLLQRAFNPGGMTGNFDTGEQAEFGAETLWNYELFSRASLADGRVALSVNLFRSDFSNAQRARVRAYTVPGGATAFWAEISNSPEARSYGAEAEIQWRASDQWSLHAGLGLLQTRITSTSNPADPIRDKAFQRSPALTAAASIDWRPNPRWLVSAQGRGHSGYFSDDANTPALRIGGMAVVDLRARYSQGPWSMFGYVRNAFDRLYLTMLSSPTRGSAGDPREIGLGFEVRH